MIPQLWGGGGGVACVSPPATGIEVMRVAEDETSFKVLAGGGGKSWNIPALCEMTAHI